MTHRGEFGIEVLVQQNEQELAELAAALIENQASKVAGSASALLVKVLTGSSIASGLAERAAANAFGRWLADNPDARLQAAAEIYARSDRQREQLSEFATLVQSHVARALLAAERALATIQDGQRSAAAQLHETGDVLSAAIWEALDGIARLETDSSELLTLLRRLDRRLQGPGSVGSLQRPIHLRFVLCSPDDVVEERRLAREVIEGLPRQPAFVGKISTELFAPDDVDPPSMPTATADRHAVRPSSCDLKLVILWSKLGSEIHRELEEAQHAGTGVWIYRRSEKPRIDIDDPAFEHKRRQYMEVGRFFERIDVGAGSTARSYSTYGDANAFCSALKSHLEAFVRTRLDESQDDLSATRLQADAELSSTSNWNWPTPWNFWAYVREKREGFLGRAWLFAKIQSWFEDPNGTQGLLILGDFGVGKSAIMAELAGGRRRLPIAACYFCQRDTNETLNPATFVRTLAAELARELPEYKAAVEGDAAARNWLDRAEEDAASAFERAVIAPLGTISEPASPSLLLIDGLDESLDFTSSEKAARPSTIIGLLTRAKRLPAWLRVLVTTRRRQDVLQALRHAFQYETLNAEDALNLADIRMFAEQRCAQPKLAERLAPSVVTGEEVAELLSSAAQGGGKFLYAVRVLNDLESGALAPDRLKALPPGMDGFYLEAFKWRFANTQVYEAARPLLGVLCIQREPMATAELAAVLQVSEAELERLLAPVEDFLTRRAGRVAFDHASITHWLTETAEDGYKRAGRFAVSSLEAEVQFGAWISRELAEGRAYQSQYLARHLGEHLSSAERNTLFRTLLFDLRWLDARLRAAGVYALLDDWLELEATPAISALEAALRQGAHVLGRASAEWLGPNLLAGQVLGRLRHRAEAELTHLCTQAEAWIRTHGGLEPLTASLQASPALLRTLEGAGAVEVLAVLPDGRLAFGSQESAIRLWNPKSDAIDAELAGHAGGVDALAVLPDGRLASGSSDNTIKLWNLTSLACEATLEGHTGVISALAVLSDGRIVSASSDNTIKLWDPQSQVCEATLVGPKALVTAIVALPDGRFATAAFDTSIKLWNPKEQTCEATLDGHSKFVMSLAVLPDNRLASASWDKTIKIWNLEGKRCEATLFGHEQLVRVLGVLPDGRLASGAEDNTIRLWGLDEVISEATLVGHTAEVTSLAVLPDGRLASGSYDTTIKLWDPKNSHDVDALQGHTAEVTALAILPNGRYASASEDGTIKLWHPKTHSCRATLGGHTGSVQALAVLPDGRLASGSEDKSIRLWDLKSKSFEAGLVGHKGGVRALAVLPNGKLVSGSEDRSIKVWNPKTENAETTLEGHGYWITALVVLPDGRIASASEDSTIRVWNGETCVGTLQGHTLWVTALAVLPDGRLASASGDKTIKIWNLANRTCEATLVGHSLGVTALVVLPDGRLASCSEDNTIRLWAAARDGRSASVVFALDGPCGAIAYAKNEEVLLAGGQSGRVHFLRVH